MSVPRTRKGGRPRKVDIAATTPHSGDRVQTKKLDLCLRCEISPCEPEAFYCNLCRQTKESRHEDQG